MRTIIAHQMHHSFVVVGLLIWLSGCAGEPVLVSAPADSEIPVFATLADAKDPIEMAAAPVINRVALIRHSTSRALKKGHITPDDAREALFCTDHVIDDLNGAVKAKNLPSIKTASHAADACLAQLEQAQKARLK